MSTSSVGSGRAARGQAGRRRKKSSTRSGDCRRSLLTKQVFVFLIDRWIPPAGAATAACRSSSTKRRAPSPRAASPRASVREIVGPIGMLPGSLYCHFATRAAPCSRSHKEGVERISAAVDARSDRSRSPGPGSRPAASPISRRCSTRPTIRRVVIRGAAERRPAVADEADRAARRLRGALGDALIAALPLARSVNRSDLRLFLDGRAQLEPDLVPRRRRLLARQDRRGASSAC